MKQWVVQGAFGLDNLAVVEAPTPTPGPGQVRIAVKAVSLNYRDLLMVRGHYDPRQPLPLVPCSDGVGVIDAVGEGVTRWSVGDRVSPIFAADWRAGTPDTAMLRSTLGGPRPGMLREFALADEGAVVAVPERLSDDEAATLPCAGVTAWRALVTEGGIRPGSTVLTLGTGGVSLFALQIAKAAGARVAITSSSDEKLQIAREMGADFTVNYRADPSWGKTVGRWAGEGVDLVVELGGAGTLDQSLRAVRPGGTLALIGVLDGVKTEVALTKILMRGIRVQGILVGSGEDFTALNAAVAAQPSLTPVVDTTFGFDQARRAFDHLAAQQHMGKVVVRVAE